MEDLAWVISGIVSLATIVVLFRVFFWARKNSEKDLATQRKLGIRRKTRLGRTRSLSNGPWTLSGHRRAGPQTRLATRLRAGDTAPRSRGRRSRRAVDARWTLRSETVTTRAHGSA
jgi:hypothetical protein